MRVSEKKFARVQKYMLYAAVIILSSIVVTEFILNGAMIKTKNGDFSLANSPNKGYSTSDLYNGYSNNSPTVSNDVQEEIVNNVVSEDVHTNAPAQAPAQSAAANNNKNNNSNNNNNSNANTTATQSTRPASVLPEALKVLPAQTPTSPAVTQPITQEPRETTPIIIVTVPADKVNPTEAPSTATEPASSTHPTIETVPGESTAPTDSSAPTAHTSPSESVVPTEYTNPGESVAPTKATDAQSQIIEQPESAESDSSEGSETKTEAENGTSGSAAVSNAGSIEAKTGTAPTDSTMASSSQNIINNESKLVGMGMNTDNGANSSRYHGIAQNSFASVLTPIIMGALIVLIVIGMVIHWKKSSKRHRRHRHMR